MVHTVSFIHDVLIRQQNTPPPNTRSILINCNTGTTIYPILDIIYLNKNKVSTELPGAGGQEETILI